MDQPEEKRSPIPRYLITSAQLQTAEGLELLELLQTVTEDGTISDEEIAALREWLDINRSADLPAISLLTDRVEKILFDGKVTEDERQAIYSDIEAILPADIRQDVISKRGARERRMRVSDQEKNGETGGKNDPVARYDFLVAGVKFEGNPGVVRYYANPGDDVLLVRNRESEKSPNAVEIRLRNGMQIGYVPGEDAKEIASLMDQGYRHRASIKKILTGGRTPIPVVSVHIFRPQADVEGWRPGSEVGGPSSPQAIAERSGYGMAACAIAAFVLILIWFGMC